MKEIEEQMQTLARLVAEKNETAIRQALRGARILDVHMEPVKDRKTLFWLTLKTNAEPIMVIHSTDIVTSVLEEDSLPERPPATAMFDLSTIKMKVKLR